MYIVTASDADRADEAYLDDDVGAFHANWNSGNPHQIYEEVQDGRLRRVRSDREGKGWTRVVSRASGAKN